MVIAVHAVACNGIFPDVEIPRKVIVTNNDYYPAPHWQDYDDDDDDYVDPRRQRSFTVAYETGITIEVAYKDGAIHITPGLPELYMVSLYLIAMTERREQMHELSNICVW